MIQTDKVHMTLSPHCCTMFAQGETHKRKSNQLAQRARNELSLLAPGGAP